MFKKTTLKNGLRIITIPQKNTSALTVLILVGAGSHYEEKQINGVSHFLEHLLFKGTKKRPSQVDIAEPLDRVGGVFNAFTSEEYTGFFAKVDGKHFELALDILSDIYLNSKLDPQDIEKERGVIIEEINMYYDHPSSYIQTLWKKLLYGDQPAGWDIAGTKKSVLNISREALKNYMKTQYVSKNTVICVAGNLNLINNKKAVSKIKNYFAGIKTNNKTIKRKKVVEKQKAPMVLLKKRETDQTHICLGTRGYNLFHSRKHAFELVGDILGGMMSSRLFIKVREEMGAAYYITTSTSLHIDNGFLVTQAGIDNKKIKEVISVILQEYKRIREEKISQKELKKAKDHLIGKMSLALESSDAQASFYGLQEILEKKILTPKQICDKINKVTPSEILKVAQDIFRPDKLNLAIIGPFENKKSFEKILENF